MIWGQQTFPPIIPTFPPPPTMNIGMVKCHMYVYDIYQYKQVDASINTNISIAMYIYECNNFGTFCM